MASSAIEANTDTINSLADTINSLAEPVTAEPPSGAIQYNTDGFPTGSSLLTYDTGAGGNLILNPRGVGPVLPAAESTFVSGRSVTIAVDTAAGGRLDINRVNSGAGGDIAVGEGFNISSDSTGTKQTVADGLPSSAAIRSDLDHSTLDHKVTFFAGLPHNPIGVRRSEIQRTFSFLPHNASRADVINQVNLLIKVLSLYGLVVVGNVIGDVTDNLVGNVIGDVTGNPVGNVIGDVTGNLL
jgi:hypothetical protein